MVLAFGGNAISVPGEEGNIPQQFQHTSDTVKLLSDLVIEGHRLVVTHGNGPQVGNVLRRVELARSEVYPIPLELCVADTQGGMGYMIAQCFRNQLRDRGHHTDVCTIITTVVVDRDDPAFKKPTKPIGIYFSEAEAEQHMRTDGWIMTKVDDRWYRRLVASPKPLEIVELEFIKQLYGSNRIVIACGGGGIPVVRDENGHNRGVEAVVDKDYASALLAIGLEADRLVILTPVDKVKLDYRKPTERALDRLTVSQSRQYLAEGQFPAGSMGPKIDAACGYLETCPNPNARALITSFAKCQEALQGKDGTWIDRD